MAADASEQEHSLGVCPDIADMTRMRQSMLDVQNQPSGFGLGLGCG